MKANAREDLWKNSSAQTLSFRIKMHTFTIQLFSIKESLLSIIERVNVMKIYLEVDDEMSEFLLQLLAELRCVESFEALGPDDPRMEEVKLDDDSGLRGDADEGEVPGNESAK